MLKLADTEFGRSSSNGMGIGRIPKVWGRGAPPPPGMGAWPTREIASPRATLPQCGRSRSDGTSVMRKLRNYRDTPENFYPLVSHLSASFKVIGTDTNGSATYDFLFNLLVIRIP